MKISSNFDSGNIEIVGAENADNIQLKIRKDTHSEFFQWFHFRVQECKDIPCVMRIENAGESSYVEGWEGYNAVASYDRHTWFRVPSSFDGKELTIKHTPQFDSVYYAYFAPYSLERLNDFISSAQLSERCELIFLGETVQKRDLNMLKIGEDGKEKKKIWLIARQHPGESMASWFMEGCIERLLDEDDALVKSLLDECVFYIVPHMNPDGSYVGNLRSNAAGANLNREWETPSLEKSPEVFHVRNKMDEIGVDVFLDVHGDEALPYNFVAGAEGNPSYSDNIKTLEDTFKDAFMDITPDFQDTYGYDKDEPGKGNLTIACNQIGERFNCLSFTIEMPFKDNADVPDNVFGWSPIRCNQLGEAVLYPIKKVLPLIKR